ncbi:MAG: hypothetical protein JNM63_05280 [Spirochaetia bacterium]|nr:hypothetical protein [Spirochaetia bacterium]
MNPLPPLTALTSKVGKSNKPTENAGVSADEPSYTSSISSPSPAAEITKLQSAVMPLKVTPPFFPKVRQATTALRFPSVITAPGTLFSSGETRVRKGRLLKGSHTVLKILSSGLPVRRTMTFFKRRSGQAFAAAGRFSRASR